jgi:hypothetical protein
MVFQDHPMGGATSSPTEFGMDWNTWTPYNFPTWTDFTGENWSVSRVEQDESRVPELALQFQRTARWPRESYVSHLRTLPKMAASA